MKKKYVLMVAGLLFGSLAPVFGQTANEQSTDGVNSVGTTDPLSVSDCETRAKFIKMSATQNKSKKQGATDKILKKKVDVLEVKCDSLNSKVNTISCEMKKGPDSVVNTGKPYIIQVCVLTNPLKELVFEGRNLSLDRVNNLYRYSLAYDTLQDAQNDLPLIRKSFPDAFVRQVK